MGDNYLVFVLTNRSYPDPIYEPEATINDSNCRV